MAKVNDKTKEIREKQRKTQEERAAVLEAFYSKIEDLHDAVNKVKVKMDTVGACFDKEDIEGITEKLAELEERIGYYGT